MGGVKRGLQLIADFLRMFLWAIKNGNTHAVNDCVDLANVWLREAKAEGGTVLLNPIVLLFSDPFSGSREQLRVLTGKYGKH